jgi:hypothetical protein
MRPSRVRATRTVALSPAVTRRCTIGGGGELAATTTTRTVAATATTAATKGRETRHAGARSPSVGAPRWQSQLRPALGCTFSDAVKTWVPLTLRPRAVFVAPDPDGF